MQCFIVVNWLYKGHGPRRNTGPKTVLCSHMNVECARLPPAFSLQCLDWQLRLPLGHQISQESIASERLMRCKTQWQFDWKVALEWIGLKDVGPSTVQLKIVFPNSPKIVAKQPMCAF